MALKRKQTIRRRRKLHSIDEAYLYSPTDVITVNRSGRIRRAEHVTRIWEVRNEYKTGLGKLHKKKLLRKQGKYIQMQLTEIKNLLSNPMTRFCETVRRFPFKRNILASCIIKTFQERPCCTEFIFPSSLVS